MRRQHPPGEEGGQEYGRQNASPSSPENNRGGKDGVRLCWADSGLATPSLKLKTPGPWAVLRAICAASGGQHGGQGRLPGWGRGPGTQRGRVTSPRGWRKLHPARGPSSSSPALPGLFFSFGDRTDLPEMPGWHGARGPVLPRPSTLPARQGPRQAAGTRTAANADVRRHGANYRQCAGAN